MECINIKKLITFCLLLISISVFAQKKIEVTGIVTDENKEPLIGVNVTIKRKIMRIYRNDIIKASAISTDDDRGLLLCSITDSGFTSIASVISAVKDKLPNKDHKKMVFEILNDTKKEYGRYNNCGTKVL